MCCLAVNINNNNNSNKQNTIVLWSNLIWHSNIEQAYKANNNGPPASQKVLAEHQQQ